MENATSVKDLSRRTLVDFEIHTATTISQKFLQVLLLLWSIKEGMFGWLFWYLFIRTQRPFAWEI